MSRVGVIRGDLVPDAPPMLLQRSVMIRTPVIRVPLWLMVGWWCAKGAAWLLLVVCRYWYLTGPALLVGGLWWRFGWPGPAMLAAAVGGLLAAWWLAHPDSFNRWCWWRLLARWRRWRYRRRWWPAMATAGLVVRFDGHEVLPILHRVTCRPGVDVLLVRMVTGQLPEDFAQVAERLAQTFSVCSVRVRPPTAPAR